jgi:hypothetical protein
LKKAIIALAAAAALVFAATAIAQEVTVADPTPNHAFRGTYTYSCPTATNPAATCQGTQDGYVRLSTDTAKGPEVQACSGNGVANNPSSNKPALQGYVYISPTGSGPAASDYGNQYIGANNNNSHDATAAPCPNGHTP